jgi:hypothetical protein
MIHLTNRLLLLAVLLATQAALAISPANASGTNPAAQLVGDQLTAQAHRYLQDRADRMTLRWQASGAAGTARLTSVATTSALAVQLARETIQLDQRRAELVQLSGGRTRAEVKVRPRSITVSDTEATVDLDERTKLFFPGKGQPAEKFESFRIQHIFTFLRKGDSWLLSGAQAMVEGPRALAPTTQFMHGADPASSENSLSANPKQSSPVGDRTGPQLSSKAAGLSAGYRYADMVAYAEKHHHEYNDYFRVFEDNDCTNFISQIVGAGGWQTTPGLDSRDPTKWFYARTTTGPDHTGDMWSRTWSAAENWYRFALEHSKRVTRLPTVYSMLPSDILQAVWDGNTSHNMDHSMFVSDKRPPDSGAPTLELYLTYHSNDQFEKPFQEILAASPSTAWFPLRT